MGDKRGGGGLAMLRIHNQGLTVAQGWEAKGSHLSESDPIAPVTDQISTESNPAVLKQPEI